MVLRRTPLARSSKSLALLLGALATLATGCQSSVQTPVEVAQAKPAAEEEEFPALEGESGPLVTRQAPRQVGDVWVHRFSGTYRNDDLILREEVIAKKDDVIIVDFILEEGDATTHLRVNMAARSERIVKVARVIGGEPVAASLADFDAMLAKTTFLPDQNQGRVAQQGQTCLVGKNALDCELSEYKVRLGDQEATLTVARNDEIKRDISGEITAVDGTVLYHAELIEMQRGEPQQLETDEGVARVDLKSRD